MKNVNKPSTSIKNWAQDDRPREKLLQKGAESLSNAELLAILINNGSRDKSAVDLAREILKAGKQDLNELAKMSLAELRRVKGIGMAKAIAIAAALELGRRRDSSGFFVKPVVRSSGDVAGYLKAQLKDHPYEVFAVVYLNRANKVNHFEIISRGGITGTVADPKRILKGALEQNATSIILCHNHPSGNLQPSPADETLTLKIREAAAYLDIKLLDHIIVSEEGHYSFAEEGLL
jgi:DNA repair protein RadC